MHLYALVSCSIVIVCGAYFWYKKYTARKNLVILLLGASSTGKSSVAKALVNLFYPQKKFIALGVDDVFCTLGNATNIIMKKEWVDGHVNFIYTSDDQGNPIVDLSMGNLGARLSRIMYDYGRRLVDTGFNLVIDEVALNDDSLEYIFKQFKEHELYVICMQTPLDERVRREHARGNRFIGHTRSQELRAYQYKGHDIRTNNLCDLYFDSSELSTDAITHAIMEHITHQKPRAQYLWNRLSHAPAAQETLNTQEALRARRVLCPPEKKPTMIVLVGASSSGKTTLSQALINRMYPDHIFVSVGIDDVFRSLGDSTKPLRRNYWVDGEINYLKSVDRDGHPIVAVELGKMGEDLMIAAYQRAIQYYKNGINVVFDDVFLSDRVTDAFIKMWADYNVYLVGVYAPLQERERRERERKNRPIGHTRSQERLAYMYRGSMLLTDNGFDFVVDTSQQTVEQNVELILNHIGNTQPFAVKKLYKKFA